MSWFNRIERKLEPFAIPHLTLILVAGQLFVMVAAAFLHVLEIESLVLMPELVMQGEWWRLLSFVFVPPMLPSMGLGVFFSAFALYMIYLFGSALEHHWGELRFNLFLLCGYALTVGVAFITPGAIASNIFISGALFLAFAYLNPDFEIYVFFILPVKIKWLALLLWLSNAFLFFSGGLGIKLGVVAAVGNFFIFFGRDLWRRAIGGRRHMKAQAARFTTRGAPGKPRHRCHVCGKNSDDFPHEDFRYCSKCEGDYCYCAEHLKNHGHVRAAETPGGGTAE